MALGDYTKTTYNNGATPGISAQRLNNNENKTKELDTTLKTHVAEDATDAHLPENVGIGTKDINLKDKLLVRPEIKDYAETVGTTPATKGTVTFDLTTGNVFNLTPTGNVTIGFSNPPADGRAGSATVILKNGATVYSKTFASAIKWVNDSVPDTSEANKTYILVFSTTNAGTTIRGACIGPYSA